MSDPPSRDSDNIRRALLRDPAVTGGEPSEVRADVRQRYDIPGPSADVRGGGRILQFAATLNREERATTQPAVAPRKQSSVSTLADALKWAGGEISQIQNEEDDEHTDYFRNAIGCIRRKKRYWPDVSSARFEGLNDIYELLLARSV